MSECRCSYFENQAPIITNAKCPMFEQENDDKEYIICSHVLIQDAKGYCEINFIGETK